MNLEERKLKKRIISLLLCLCMVFSLLPTAVLAADGEDPDVSAGSGQVMQQNPENPDDLADPDDQENLGDQENQDDQAGQDDQVSQDDQENLGDQAGRDDLKDLENSDGSDAPQLLGEGLGSEMSGNCGAVGSEASVQWALTQNNTDSENPTYTLTISGNGAMADYYAQYVQRATDFSGDIAPWRRALLSNPEADRTTDEVVPITEVEIADGVTRIGSGAFAYTELTGTVTFNANVTSYGDGVFARDTSITAVDWTNFKPTEKIKDGWATVYTEEHIAVPYAFFDGCSNLDTSIVDGTTYSGQLVLPNTIKAIYVAAFRGTGFSTVDFSNGLTSIQAVGSYAITKLANMTEFTYPGNVDFYGTNGEGQNNVIQGGGIEKLTIAKEVTKLPASFCTNTENLTVIEFESGSQLTEIGKTAFYNTQALKSIDIPSTVTSIGESAFADCFSLEKIELGQIELLGANTFARCSSLETAKIQGSPSVIYPTNMFGTWGTGHSAAPLKTLEIGAGKIQFSLNSQKDSIETIVLGDGVTEVPANFAAYCTKLTSVSLPDALTSVPVNAFKGCSSLEKVDISENSKLQSIGSNAFQNSALTQIYIPKDVTSIGTGAFNRTPITVFDMSDVLAESMTVGDYAINNWYDSSRPEEFPAWKDNFKYIYVRNSGAAASVKEKTSNCKYAFFVTNGGSVDATKTGFAAVYRAGYTAKWYEEGGTPVTGDPETGKTYYVQWTLGGNTGYCGAAGNVQNVRWTLVNTGDGYTLSIDGTGDMEDYTCNITGSKATQPWRESETGVAPTAITRVVVGGSVTNIGNFACDGLSQVKEYNIAASVEDIGPWGVCGQNAETYNLNGSTHYVTVDGVLMSADGKTLVSYPGGKDAVDEYVIPNTVETILAGAFVGSDAKKVVIPSNVTSFPRYSFGGSTVEEIEFNANVNTLEGGAFSGLSKLKSLVFGGTTLTTIKEQACSDLSSLTEITFPDSLTTIGAQAFKVLPEDGAAAPNLKKVTFGKGMSTIGDVVFLRQSALEVIDMTHCAKPPLEAVGLFSSRGFDGNVETPYTHAPIVYTADADVAGLVQPKNGNHLIYAVTNGGTFPADTEFEAGKLAEPKKEGCLFLGWYADSACSGEKVTTFKAGKTYYAKWMDHIPEPTDADLANGLVTVKCLNPVAHNDVRYGLNAAVAPKKYETKQVSATEYSVTYNADAFAVNGHSLYSADTLNWKLTYDGSKWNLAPQTRGVDDVVLVTHAPTTFDEVTKFIDGRTDVINTSCVNGETATCAYGLMVAFVNPDHVVSVEQEKDSSGQPIRGSYIATLKMDQFAEACAKACNSKSFADSPRAHDVLSQNPVQWRFQVRQAEVSTDAGTEKPYVWSAEPVEAGKDDVCQVAHNWVVTFNPDNGEPAFTQDVKYEGKATEPAAPEKEGCEFTGWYLDEAEEPFSFDSTITSDITLTAKWKLNTYTVTFDPNGGSVDPTSKTVTFSEPYGELPVPTRKGYNFAGWYTEAEDGTVVTADTTVTATTDHTLYAHWTLIPPAADSKPSYSGVNVRVKCVDNKSEHKQGAYFYGLVYGLSDYSGINEPESWVEEDGEYFYTLTINKDVYIARYANTTKTAHTEVGENKTEVKWQWNGTKWVLLNEKDDKGIVLTINVKCEEKQTVNVVIYRNGDTEKAYQTVALEKMPKGTVIDLTKLNIADYYTANYTGRYDFYGWFNDGAWNEYKRNPERAGLDSITVNGWTNIICMVYDYENVVYYMSDADRVADNRLFATTARKGAALPTADAPTATRDGYTFTFWSREGQTTDVTGQTVNGWTNLVANWKVTPHNIYAYARLNSYFAPLTTDGFDTPITLNDATLSRLGLGSYNSLGYISIGSFDFDAMPLTEDLYFGDDEELTAALAELAQSIALETGVSKDTAEKIAWTALYKTVNEEDTEPGYPTDDEEGYQFTGNLNLATVRFDAGGENVTGMPEDNYLYDDVAGLYDFYYTGDTFTLPTTEPTREGYSFEGWSVKVIPAENDADCYDADGANDAADETLLKAGATYTITEGGVIFTAQWKLNTYIIASTLRINGNEPVKETGKTYSWSHRYGGDFGVTIDYTEMFKALKDKTLEVDAANEPYDAEIKLCFPGSKDRLFNEEILTYGQEGGGWNPDVKNTAYIWGYATTSYEVIFNSDGGSAVDTQIVKYGEKAVKPEDPTMKGYNFLGWFDKDGNLFDFDTEITHKTELTAQWEKKDYIIASDLRVNNGEPVKDEGETYSWTHRYGGKYEETIDYQPMFDALKARALEADKANEPNPTKVDVELRFPGSKDRLFNEEIHTYGQDGGGWSPGVKNTAYIWGYAWTYYDVTFVTPEGATTVDAQLIKNGDCAAKPADPTKEGWKFLGWYADAAFETEFNFDAPITKKTSVYAKFELVSTPIGDIYVRYDVLHIKQLPDGSYDLANAEVEHLSAKKDTTVTAVIKDYRATHHVNVNRTLSKLTGTAIQPYMGVDGKPVYTILSVYYDLDFHTLTFDTMGGSKIAPETVRHGLTVAKPKDPVNGGYIFDGWYTDKTYRTPYNFATPLTEDITIYSKWVWIVLPGTTVKKNTPKLNTADHFAYVQGYPDGTVKPTANITRAETAAILFRLMDEDSCKTYYSTKSGFRDVATGSWYNTYVATLNNADVITDSSNGYFRPNEAITRAELAAMLAQFADIKSAANSFNDVSARHWASDEIAVCAKMGWINGYPDGSFRPDATITRAEMMAMINRALGRTPESADDLLSGMKTWRDNANVNAWYYLDVQEATNSHTYTKSDSHETWKKLI